MTTTPTSGAADLPEALRLADAISNLLCSNEVAARTIAAAADELVRLHALAAGQPAPSPAPAEWLEQAFREGWAACRDSEFVGEEAEEWSFGSSQANGRMIDIQQAAPTSQADTQPAPVLDEREEFEAWLRSVWTAGYSCPKFDSGKYVHGDAQQLWDCWQARAARAPADSVLYDPKAALEIFQSARAGSDKPIGYLRGILAVIAHWESRPEPHRWMVPAKEVDSVLEDAARYRLLRRGQHWSVIDGTGNDLRAEALDAAVDAARKQGEKQ